MSGQGQVQHTPDALTSGHIAAANPGEHKSTNGGVRRNNRLGENRRGQSTGSNPNLPQGNALGMIMGGFAAAAPFLAKLQSEMLKILQEDNQLAADMMESSNQELLAAGTAAAKQGELESQITTEQMRGAIASAAGTLASAAVVTGTTVAGSRGESQDNAENSRLDGFNQVAEEQHASTSGDVRVGSTPAESEDPQVRQNIERLKRGNFNFNDVEGEKATMRKVTSKDDLDTIQKKIGEQKNAIEKRQSNRLTKMQGYNSLGDAFGRLSDNTGRAYTAGASVEKQKDKGLESSNQTLSQGIQQQIEDAIKKFQSLADSQIQNMQSLNQTENALAGNR